MRVFADFKEAKNEIARDLNELGTTVFAGYQSKEMSEAERELMVTKELTDYDYVVLRPRLDDLEPTQPWAEAEWEDRVAGILEGRMANPGNSWTMRREVWEPLLEPSGRFSYTYADRFAEQRVDLLIDEMQRRPYSRQIFISVWHPQKDTKMAGKHRVPCTLGYQITAREDKVQIAYIMRSSDFKTHFDNDLWLAHRLQLLFCEALDLPAGKFVHKVGSLHVYATDVQHVF